MSTRGGLFLSTVALAALSLSSAALARPRPTPAPAPASAPAPSPTPVSITTSATSTTKVPMADQSRAAYQITVKHEYAASGPNANKPQFQGNMARVTSTVKYDPVTQTYTVRDTGNTALTASFGPGQQTSSNANFNNYSRVAGGTTETFKVSNIGAVPTAGVELSYVQYGHWRRVTPGGGNFGNTSQNDTYLVFGTKTPPAALTGTGNYNTYLDGTYVNSEKSYDIDGTGTLTANFGLGTLTFGATMTGTPASGPALAIGTINGSGTIKASSSSFAATGNNVGGFSIDMAGYFYGPAADELGAVFNLRGPLRGNGGGALVGSKP